MEIVRHTKLVQQNTGHLDLQGVNYPNMVDNQPAQQCPDPKIQWSMPSMVKVPAGFQ